MSIKLTIEINGQPHEVELSDAAVEALKAIAARNNLSVEAALEQAVVNEKFLEDKVDSGSKLLIEKDDKFRELVFG